LTRKFFQQFAPQFKIIHGAIFTKNLKGSFAIKIKLLPLQPKIEEVKLGETWQIINLRSNALKPIRRKDWPTDIIRRPCVIA